MHTVCIQKLCHLTTCLSKYGDVTSVQSPPSATSPLGPWGNTVCSEQSEWTGFKETGTELSDTG